MEALFEIGSGMEKNVNESKLINVYNDIPTLRIMHNDKINDKINNKREGLIIQLTNLDCVFLYAKWG